MLSLIWRRVIGMFNFTLAESSRGLRITRGLTNLTSQSVPINRIQGVKTSQPLLWRPMGWYRADIDILGYAQGDSENNESTSTSVLLPVASLDEVELALGRVLPGFDLDGVELHTSPNRARWLRWFDFWTLRYGWDDRILITEQGWITHVRDVVPHAKTQSVRIEQGPLQRALGLADVHVHTPRGPVNAVAHQLDEHAARDLALTQLDRARAARTAEREHRKVRVATNDDHEGEAELLAAFGTSRDQLLGSGGESEVFALDHDRVLRLYRGRHEAPRRTAFQLRALYESWRGTDIGIELPVIIDMGRRNGRFYTVDRRFSGRSFSSWLQSADMTQRRPALISFLDATEQLQRLPRPVPGFARLIGDGAPQQFSSLGGLLASMLQGPLETSRTQLERDVPVVEEVWNRLHRDLAERFGLLRCWCTVMSARPTRTSAKVRKVWLSPELVTSARTRSVPDPLMDVAGALIFLELEPYADATCGCGLAGGGSRGAAWTRDRSLDRCLSPLLRLLLLECVRVRPDLYAWCLRQLSR